MATRGRRMKITAESFINAVKKKRTLSESVLGEYLGLDRSTIFRFKTNNPEIVAQMDEFIKQYENVIFNGMVSFDVFQNINVIKEWIDVMKQRQVGAKQTAQRLRALYNVCNYLQVHPQKLNVDLAGKVVNEMKLKKREGEIVPKGLSYSTIRSAIRSFFTTVLGISGEMLSAKGVDAAATERSGEFSKEKVTFEQRRALEDTLKTVIAKASNGGIEYVRKNGEKGMISISLIDYPFIYEELLTLCKFCYYTGTRKMAALNAELSNPKNMYNGVLWTINIIDKGKKGGHRWEKLLTDFALEDFKKYVNVRFDMPYEMMELKARSIGFIFPSVAKREHANKDVSTIVGLALHYAGKDTEIPIHIWRHTAAQDGLVATNYNYELVASLFGWDSTTILKKHYGKMSDESKVSGLRKMMGIEIPEEKPKPLKW